MFEIVDAQAQEAVIKVIGVGGCGGNAVDHMIDKGVEGVEFISANTDAQALRRCAAKIQLQLGAGITKGLGAGADPEVGRKAALEDRERVAEAIAGADMLFLTAGMGGGTGTGAAPVVAELAKELGILTVAVVTKPFAFEGKRQRIAQAGIEQLTPHVDSLIVVPNDKLMEVLGNQVTLDGAFKAANDVLHGAVAGIAEIISCPGMINVDFADAHGDGRNGHGDDGLGALVGPRPGAARRRAGGGVPVARGRQHLGCARCAGQHLGEQGDLPVAGDVRRDGHDQGVLVGFGASHHRHRVRRCAGRPAAGDDHRDRPRQARGATAGEAVYRGGQQDRHRQPAAGGGLRRA
jgi:hypothetical protein